MAYSDKLYDYYLELAQSPCTQTCFAGSDMRFSSEYEVLEEELRKAQSMHGCAKPDWHKVLETGESLLRHQSKDLRVAVWLTWALHQRDSFPGLLAGLGVLRYLCEQHWEAVYPEKSRTRGAAFSWLALRLEPLFTQSLSLQSQQPLFQTLLVHLARLDELWSEQLGSDAPLLLPLRRQLAQRLERATQGDSPAAGLSGVIVQVKQAATQLLSPEAELMYVCLSLGFEGKYRVMERGEAQLEGVRDALYRQIRHVRGDRHSRAAPPGTGRAMQARMHMLSATWVVTLVRLLEQPFISPLNDGLVTQARQELRGESLAEVVYRALREQARGLEPLRLAEGNVFVRVEPPIPGFYTKKYLQYFEKQGPRLVNSIAQDNWVLGEATDLSAVELRRLLSALEQRYFSEYADAWSQALGRVRLLDSDNLQQGVDQLASLTSAQSALVQLLQQVRENTRLLPMHERLEALGQQAGELGAVASSVLTSQLQGQGAPDAARRALQRRFEPLHQLLDEEQNPGVELTQIMRQLDELHLQLLALSRESAPEQAAFKMVKQRMEGQQPVLSNMRNAAARLPLPLKGWFEGVADDTWRHLLDDAYGYVNQRYQSEVYGFYVKSIQRRYPFNAHSGSEVALGDFQEFFKPRGAMARFYEGYLRPFVSVEGSRYRLRGLDGRSLPMSRSLLDQLTKAQTIRQGFFTEDQGEWSVRFTLAPYSLDQAVSRSILMDTQQLSREQAQAHPEAKALTRAIGGQQPLSLEILELSTRPGDVFLLCSDGLYQGVSHGELGSAMSVGTPRRVVDRLFADVLRGPARDDLTAVVIQS